MGARNQAEAPHTGDVGSVGWEVGGMAPAAVDTLEEKGGSSLHSQSLEAYDGHPYAVLNTKEVLVHAAEASRQGPRRLSSVDAYGAARCRRQIPFSRWILDGRARSYCAPVKAEVCGPAWAAVGVGMSLAHDGGDRQAGDGSGEEDAPGAGGCTDYEVEAGTVTGTADAEMVVVGATQDLDVMESMSAESDR